MTNLAASAEADVGGWTDGALDGEVMRVVFARHLTLGARVLRCRVTRQRHRPGRRRFVQYAVSVLHADGRADELRVTGQWHADPAHTAALAAKLTRRSRTAAPRWTAALPPAFHDVPTGLLGTTYPWDRRLPSLVDVANGTAPELQRPMADWMRVAPSAIERCRVETVRYREQLNAVCRYSVAAIDGGASRQATFYVKVYADDRGAEAVARLAGLARGTPATAGSARVGRAVAYVRDLRALVLAAAPGHALDALPVDDASRVVATLGQVGRALARFGRRAVSADVPLAHGDRLDAAARSAAALADAMPAVAPRLAAMLARIRDRWLAGPAGLVHGDLKLEHVFVDAGEVWLIDVDSCHRGDPVWDLALLQARWHTARCVDGDDRDLGGVGGRALSDAYLAESDGAAPTRLPVLTACACLDVAAGSAKRRDPGWPRLALRLLDQAERVCAGCA